MNKNQVNARSLSLLCILIIIPSAVLSQESTVTKTQKEINIESAKNGSPHSLFASAGYGNNMIYMGSNVSQDKPFYSGSLTYGYLTLGFDWNILYTSISSGGLFSEANSA